METPLLSVSPPVPDCPDTVIFPFVVETVVPADDMLTPVFELPDPFLLVFQSLLRPALFACPKN